MNMTAKPLGNPGSLSLPDLRAERDALRKQEDAVSFVRRLAQGRVDLVTAVRQHKADGTGTVSVFGHQMRFDLADGFPVLTTKKRATVRPSADDVVSYLSWHGVNATARIMSTQSKSVGEALAAETVSLAADLLVIGSYSRRRLREMVMGGVTSHVLERANLPVLMVH